MTKEIIYMDDLHPSLDINYYDCCEGDTNDVYRRFILKGTIDQVDQYLKSEIKQYYRKFEVVGDFGYGKYNKNGDLEYYIEAYLPELSQQEIKEIESYSIEEYNKRFFYHQIIDLTENMEVLNQ